MIQQANKYVHGLIWCLSSRKSLTHWNQLDGDWIRVICHGNKICYRSRCVFCRAISLQSFKVLGCKLTEIALFIYLIWYYGWWRHQFSHLYILLIWQTYISPALMQTFANGKRPLFFLPCDTPNKLRGKNLIIVPL